MTKTERALRVLEYVSSSDAPPTHAELMRVLGVQRSTLSDVLAELRRLRYVEVRDRRYLPGLRLMRFVHTAARHAALGAGVRETLERLAADTGETAVWVLENGSGQDVVAVDQVESPNRIRYVADIGEPWPMTTTAAGRVFLALRDAPAADVADPLAEELARTREQGFSVVRNGPITAVAAPVVDKATATLLGVLSIVGPSERIDDPERQIWPLMAEHADELGGAASANA